MLKIILSTLINIENKLKNPAPFLRELGNTLMNIAQDCFQRESDPDGHKWKPLKQFRYKHKKAERYSTKVANSKTP